MFFSLASAAEPEKGTPDGYCSDNTSLAISYVNYLKVRFPSPPSPPLPSLPPSLPPSLSSNLLLSSPLSLISPSLSSYLSPFLPPSLPFPSSPSPSPLPSSSPLPSVHWCHSTAPSHSSHNELLRLLRLLLRLPKTSQDSIWCDPNPRHRPNAPLWGVACHWYRTTL